MALVFKVGEHKDFVAVPQGFPQCQDYMPEASHQGLIHDKNETGK